MSESGLAKARQEFERRWHTTRDRFADELGVAPRRTGLLALLLAMATGLAVGVGLRGRKGRDRSLPPGSDRD